MAGGPSRGLRHHQRNELGSDDFEEDEVPLDFIGREATSYAPLPDQRHFGTLHTLFGLPVKNHEGAIRALVDQHKSFAAPLYARMLTRGPRIDHNDVVPQFAPKQQDRTMVLHHMEILLVANLQTLGQA